MKLVFFAIVTSLLAGCVTNPTAQELPIAKEVRAPDGRLIKNIKCKSDPNLCLEGASASCIESDMKYQVIKSHSTSGNRFSDMDSGVLTWYNMTYECGPSDGKLPEFAFQEKKPSSTGRLDPNLFKVTPFDYKDYAQPEKNYPTRTDCRKDGDTLKCNSY